MKLEIYQIGKETPLTVVECDDWDIVNSADLYITKNGKTVALFNFNNIAGFKVISEDDEKRSENNG